MPRETAVRGVYRLIVRHGRQVAAGLGLVLAATVVRAVLHALVGGAAAFLPFSVAVVLAAWYGRVAGITAAVASSITAAVWFVSAPAPAGTLATAIFWFAMFLLASLVMAGVVDAMRRAQLTAEQAAARAREAQDRLDAEADARRRTEFAFVHLLRSNLFGVGVAAPDGRWLEANPALLEMLAVSRDDVQDGRALWRGMIELDAAERRAIQLGRSQDGASGPVEVDFVRGNGTSGTALLHMMSPAGADWTVVLAVDISFRKEIERALHESQARFRLLVESVADHAMFMLDPDGRVMSWNAGAERLLGYRAEEVVGRHASIFHSPDDQHAGRPASVLRSALRDSRHESDGWRLRKDGSRFWANVVVAPIRTDGEPIGFATIMRDLSARHTTDILLKSILDAATDGIIGIDEFGTIRSFNAAAERMFDYTAEQVMGSNISILLPEPYRTNFVDYLARFASSGHARVGRGRQLVGLRGDGTTFPLELAVSEFMLDGRRYFTGMVRDMTRQRALEEQLQQAQKMHAVGQLAGGIAHDFNNLLTIIAGHTELLLAKSKERNPLTTALNEIRDAGMRASGLTRQLLAFSRRAVLEPKVLDLNSVVRDTRKMLGRIIGEDVELVTRMAPRLRRVSVDQGQIGQVLINLVVNARDAMPDGGRIEIETANCDIEPGPDTHPEARPGPSVMLTVRDHGVGMTPETMQRIFEPFFTTKQPGAGTGLGLAMVYGIVRQSGGHVEVTSEPDRGSEFRVILPAADTKAAVRRPRKLGDASVAGTETLLVVEDDESVKRLAVLALRAHGYTVLEAANGAEALRVITGREDEIDLVITDVVMPVMGGRQLVEALKPLASRVRVLYVSGYTDDAVIRHGVQRADVAFLQKPYTPHGLAEKVRQVLDGGG